MIICRTTTYKNNNHLRTDETMSDGLRPPLNRWLTAIVAIQHHRRYRLPSLLKWMPPISRNITNTNPNLAWSTKFIDGLAAVLAQDMEFDGHNI
jgi:hypothetical protein